MSFDVLERSRSRGRPQTLYRFQYGDIVYGYTDAEDTITVAGQDYLPEPVDRGALNSSGSLDKAALTLNVKRDNAVAELFRVFPPSDVVTVTIFQGHDSDPAVEFLAVWTGRVISCGREGSMAALLCEPVSTSLKRPGLRRRWQYPCPHALYGPQCGVNRAAFTVETMVSGINGAVVSLPTGWNGAHAEAGFLHGILEWEGPDGRRELRTILRVNEAGNQILVGGKVAGLSVGATVKLSRGCDKQMASCTSFANIKNFGGQPWIPKKNPIGLVNQFY